MKPKFVLFLAIIALCLLFNSCGENKQSEVTDTSATSTTEAGNTEETLPEGAVSLEGYSIVRSIKTENDVYNACKEASAAIAALTGTAPEINVDYIKGVAVGDTVSTEDKEILVGCTNRIESVNACDALNGDYDYSISVVGAKIVIAGNTDTALCAALRVFCSELESCTGGYITDEMSVSRSYKDENDPVYRLCTEYTIINPEGLEGDIAVLCATTVRDELKKMTGVKMTVKRDNVADASQPEILLGLTNRPESSALFGDMCAMDYVIGMVGNKILLCGGCTLSTLRAVDKFIEMVKNGELDSLEAGTLSYSERFYDIYPMNPICLDINSFTPVWSGEFTAPDWMRDFSKKTYEITNPTGRLMCIAHRGDMTRYPENSIEGFASAILCGADIIETDVRLTKDHVLVLMHDESLKRTTDFASKKGKNGLPTSDNIADWTYAQLLELNLLDYNGKTTEYKITTLYEAMMVMNDRCFIYIDNKLETLTPKINLQYHDEIFQMAEDIECKEIFFFGMIDYTFVEWRDKNPSDTEFAAYVELTSGYLKNGTKRTPYWLNEDAPARSTAYETEANYAAAKNIGHTLLWINDILGFAKYVAQQGEGNA